MRTTLDIDEHLVDEVLTSTGEKSKSRAVAVVLEWYLRQKAIEELRAIAGKVELVDDFEEMLEAQKLRELERLDQARL